MSYLILHSLAIIILVLVAVAFFSLFERKVLALSQNRLGPNKVGVGGIFQPFADAMKLVSKSDCFPIYSDTKLIWLPSGMMFVHSMSWWVLLPVWAGSIDIELSIMVTLCIMSLGVYGLVFSGWFSNSKYALLGSARSIAQSISYEIGLSISLVMMSFFAGSMSFSEFLEMNLYHWLFTPFTGLSVMMLMLMIAELNRSPMDLSEGESELVSGFCVEFGASKYTLVFMAESASLLWMSILWCILFSNPMMSVLLVFLLVWIRSTMPRMRYDHLMNLGWMCILPMILGSGSLFILSF